MELKTYSVPAIAAEGRLDLCLGVGGVGSSEKNAAVLKVKVEYGVAVCLVVVLKAEEVEVARGIIGKSFVIKEGELNVKVAA